MARRQAVALVLHNEATGEYRIGLVLTPQDASAGWYVAHSEWFDSYWAAKAAADGWKRLAPYQLRDMVAAPYVPKAKL